MWPSTRSGPLGRTVIFTGSSDIVLSLFFVQGCGQNSKPNASPRLRPNRALTRNKSHDVDFHLVHITPAPVLARLDRPHDRVPGCMKMPGRMSMRRGVAAPYMPAGQAHSKMHPVAMNLQTLLAPSRQWLHLVNLIHVSTFHEQHLPSPSILSLLSMACRPGPLRGARSLRDGYTPSVGAPVGRDQEFSRRPSGGPWRSRYTPTKWARPA
jgi:hypothetical protein